VPACAQCGRENPRGSLFCNACAAPLEESPTNREGRKTVTVLFSDVTGSTALGERLDPESLRRVMARYFEETKVVLERHGGSVEKFIGDAVMAVFGVPVLHEDDALRAVRAASELHERLASLNDELERDFGIRIETRMGINTGEVVTGTEERLATGDALNVASRLEHAAGPGEILIGEQTLRLVRDAVSADPVAPLLLKGKADPYTAYRLLAVVPGAPASARRLDSPLVGRARELALLRQAFERAVAERSCHLFTVLGPAGVGKSRLVAELVRELERGATALSGRCLPYGEGITFWPVSEVLRQLGAESRTTIASLVRGEEDADLIGERLAGAVGLEPGSAPIEETFWAFRKLLEYLARRQPLVLVLDDVHWAESTFLDLVDHVADWARDSPILLVCLARPELLDGRPGWGGGKFSATSVLLEPLPDEACERLIENLLGPAELTVDVGATIIEAAEGNPLFVEEMLAMLIDDGLLERRNGSWVARAGLIGVSVPPTIQALLAARLDRLEPQERDVLARGAVEGKVFHRGAVVELVPEGLRAQVGGHLMSLVRKQLIRPDRAQFPGEDGFRFRHLLVRDAAYAALSKETRAGLHERFAGWLERRATERLEEYEEIVGYHFEQAYRYRAALGPVGPGERDLANRAGERLASSGRRALGDGDVAAARSLLGRAAELLPAEGGMRLALLPDLGAALRESGDYQGAVEVLAEAMERARAARNEQVEAHARMVWLRGRLLFEPPEVQAEVEREARTLAAEFERLEDEKGLAASLFLLAMLSWNRGRVAQAVELFERAREHARRGGDARVELELARELAFAYFDGPMPVSEGLRRLNDLSSGAARWLPALNSGPRAGFEAMLGRFDDARRSFARCLEAMEELGLKLDAAAERGHVGGFLETLAGDLVTAERHLRDGLVELERMGEKGYLSTTAAQLAGVLYAQGRYEEAEEFARMSELAATPGDLGPQMMLRGVRAKVLARLGRLRDAEALAREAVALGEKTDFLNNLGDVHVDLAEVLRLAGRSEEAEAALEEAMRRYEQKGNLVSADQTRRLLEGLRR
jgi:class 3 adenylate cyclase/tetratricopeptide (TPR) repeat protein